MIEIKSNALKSELFNKLIRDDVTCAGIIFDDHFIIPNTFIDRIYQVEEPTIEGTIQFINDNLIKFRQIVIYSNYPYYQIKPFIDKFKVMEKGNLIDFVVMYRY